MRLLCSYGTSYDSLSLGQSNSGYVKNNYANDSSQGKAGGTSNNTAAGSKCLPSPRASASDHLG